MAPLVFLGGIYGSGKSTLCSRTASLLSAVHLKASDLAAHTTRGFADEGKAVDNIPANQERVLANLERHRGATELILLDGHFCIYNRALEIEDVATTVFLRMRPDLLILVDVPPSVAWQRLQKREQAQFNVERLTHLAERERLNASRVAALMNLSLEVLSADAHAADCAALVSSRIGNERVSR